MKVACSLLSIASLLALSGCGDGIKRAPLIGMVHIDGKPLDSASVQFTPLGGTPGEGALGISDSIGVFEVISSRRDDAGIPPGEYSVRVSRFADPDGTPLSSEATQADHPDAIETVPGPYSGSGSPLKIVIPENGGEIEVNIPAKLIERKTWK